MMRAIDVARKDGHSLGGSAEVVATGVPPGLGSHVEWDRKLDGCLARALMSIPSVKAIEIGEGLEVCRKRGVDSHDTLVKKDGSVKRLTNFAGGIEGGISNGENIVVRVYGKPIPTAQKRVRTLDMNTLEAKSSPYVRSDVCVIPALSGIAEAATAWELICAFLERFGGDHIEDTQEHFKDFVASLKKRGYR
jgi:chorismate synthase